MQARGSGTHDTTPEPDMAAQFRKLGVPAEQLQGWQQARSATPVADATADGGEVRLAAHLWPAVELGMTLRSQVRTSFDGRHLRHEGLDYARLTDTKRDLGLPTRGRAARALLHQFRVVEAEMMNVLNGRQAQAWEH